MNKTELLAALQAKYSKVSSIADVTETLSAADKDQLATVGAKLYRVNYVDVANGAAQVKGQNIVVADDGLAGEEAIPQGSNPLAVASTFRVDAKAFIKANAPAGLLKITVLELDEDEKYAIVRAYIETAGTITEPRYLIYDDAGTIKAKKFA